MTVVSTDAHALLTPAMRSVLQRMRQARRAPLHSLSPAQARAAYAKGAEILEVPAPPLPRVEDFHVPARDGHPVPVRLYAPEAARPLPVLVFYHGGGFTVGGIGTHDILCRVLAAQAGCAVLSVDYRLAPEHAFPTAVEDAWDVLAWVHAQGGTRGLDTTRVAVGGDSAGGSLAAVSAISARDTGLPLRLQVLWYPGTAADMATETHRRFERGFVLEREMIDWFFAQYLPDLPARRDWRFAPLEAPDLDGVAPLWLGLAECDPMTDDGLLYADRLRMQGVPVDLEIYRGMVHEFIKMGRAIPEARQTHADAAAALRRAFGMDSNPAT
jgi:acetyl esterase